MSLTSQNTDFDTAQASSSLQKLASEGILLTNYNGVTHPSEVSFFFFKFLRSRKGDTSDLLTVL
jgi:hypothetical protein